MPAVFFDLDPTLSGVTLPKVPAWSSLYGSPDQAAVRPLRARDVRPGDRWVGTLDTARFVDRTLPLERLRGYWGYEFIAAPVTVDDGRIQLRDGDPYAVDPDDWMLVVPRCSPVPPAPEDPDGLREFTVMWEAQFEASTPLEAAWLAYEQFQSYADVRSAWPPVLNVAHHGGSDATVTIDLNKETGR
ncbi:hypothetical protein ACFQ6U_14095 [Streptomyces sp. NPDC056465]|uniref:hypothetical protein n=1 Tax=Streptomyces sp. NPDC056465 TaxID=3345829 RepID=UPI003679E766